MVRERNRRPHSTLKGCTPEEVLCGRYTQGADHAVKTREEMAEQLQSNAEVGHQLLRDRMAKQIESHNSDTTTVFQVGELVAVADPKTVESRKKVPLALLGVAKVVSVLLEPMNSYQILWQQTTKKRGVTQGKLSSQPWNGRMLHRIPADIDIDLLKMKISAAEEFGVRHIFCSFTTKGNVEYLTCWEGSSVSLSSFEDQESVGHLLRHYRDIPDATVLGTKKACLAICKAFGPQGIAKTQQTFTTAIVSAASASAGSLEDTATENISVESLGFAAQVFAPAKKTEEDAQDTATEEDNQSEVQHTPHFKQVVAVSTEVATVKLLQDKLGLSYRAFPVPPDGNCFWHACFVLVKAFDLQSKLLDKGGKPMHPCDLKKMILEYVFSLCGVLFTLFAVVVLMFELSTAGWRRTRKQQQAMVW
jgi:hypothetical protein